MPGYSDFLSRKLTTIFNTVGDENFLQAIPDHVPTATIAEKIREADPDLLVPAEFEHHLSMLLTGLPVTGIVGLLHEDAAKNPQQMGDDLIFFRMLGLSPSEQGNVPAHQLHLLRNFEQTVDTIKQMAVICAQPGHDPERDRLLRILNEGDGKTISVKASGGKTPKP